MLRGATLAGCALARRPIGARPCSASGAEARVDGRAQARAAPANAAGHHAETSLFAKWAQGYAAERFGQQIAVLLAGAVTAAGDLGLGGLRDAGADVIVSLIDDDQPVNRAAQATHPDLGRCALGDLRTVPLPQRSYDIVQCTLLLDRIHHAELVLDRLTGALKPGGLLLLQIRRPGLRGGLPGPGAARRARGGRSGAGTGRAARPASRRCTSGSPRSVASSPTC